MTSRSPQPLSPLLDVLFYTPWIGALLRPGATLPTGGAETQILLVSRELAARGHNVGLVAFDVPGGLPPQIDGVRVITRPAYRPHRRPFGKFVEMWRIWDSIHRHRSAVVVKRGAGIDVGLVAVFSRLRGQRFIFSTANVVDFTFATLMPERRNLLLYHLGVRMADRVIVQTDEQKTLCRRYFKRPASTIRSIAEPAADTEHAAAADPLAFVWAGRIVGYKQPLAYIELARAMPHARFVMVGVPVPDGDVGTRLVAEVADAASQLPNLEIVEPLARAALVGLIATSVAVVNTADFEGMSNVVLEGWVRGVPSLALSHDPDGVIARYGLGGFAEGDRDRLRVIAEGLWSERRDRAAMAARCRDYVARHHSPSVVAAQWEAALGLCQTAPVPRESASLAGASACAE